MPAFPGVSLPRVGIAVVAVATAGLRIAWLSTPPGRDEAGYLMIAAQWHPGRSVYGDYFVDRPPLLIGFFALGHLLGGLVALRLLAALVAGATVVLAYALGLALTENARTAVWPAVAAAAFVSTPQFDVRTTNGELLAVPVVMAGLLAVVHAWRGRGKARARSWLLAGVSATAAGLVKQDFVDVFVFAGAVGAASWLPWSAAGFRVRLRDLAWFAGGSVACVSVALLVADLLGTTPRSLWDALVVFRFRAAHLLAQTHDLAAGGRLAGYPRILLLTGVLTLVLAFVVRLIGRRPGPLVVGSVLTIAWEVFAVLAGQEAWPHYLVGLTPGLTLAAAVGAVGTTRLRSWPTRLSVGYAAAATVVAVALATNVQVSREQLVGRWLHAAASDRDGAVVLLGQPSILLTAGLESPYQHLFQLPMRVQDPHFVGLRALLASARAPAWVLLDTEHRHAQGATSGVLRARYAQVSEVCGYRVYLRRHLQRHLPATPARCRSAGGATLPTAG